MSATIEKVIHGILETVPPKPQYILAVEQTPCSLKQIVKSLSKAMGRGKIQEMSSPEAFLDDAFTQTLFERFTINLNMEPGFIVDDLELEWKNELNLAENMDNIVTEFRKSRNLKPLRILLHGPPAAGKSRLAQKLCEIYGVQHITVKSMIEDITADMKDKLERTLAKMKEKEEKEAMESRAAETEDEEGEEEAEEDEEPDIEELEEQIKDIEGTMATSEGGKLPDEHVIRLMKKYLLSNKCQNQGYVLDGYPKTIEQARELFGAAAGGEEEVEEEEEGGGEGAAKILPDYVITLQAPDDFLTDRIMTLPEKDIQDTHYTEEHMLRRLAIYRNNNTEDNTLLNFFDVLEIHPVVFDVTTFRERDMGDVLKDTCEKLGPPIGFGLTIEEEKRIHECEAQELKIKEEAEKLEQELLERRALEEHQVKMEEWSKSLEKLQKEEEKLVIAQSEPLRNYLMKYVFPTLTKGLIEVANYKPQDPVDYLAEYLFKENPEGHMFDPTYTREGELLSDEKLLDSQE